jgi:hypothetical protein
VFTQGGKSEFSSCTDISLTLTLTLDREHVSPLVIGVSRAVFGRVDSIQEGRNRMDAAESAGLTARL